MIFALINSALLLALLVKFFRFFEDAEPPRIHHTGSNFIKAVVKGCPTLSQTYEPPLFWGKSGHIQTAVYAKQGRFNCPFPRGERFLNKLEDGSTVSYDVFHPAQKEVTRTLLVCPGICNSSEKCYIRTFVSYCVRNGCRVAVLNHLGALESVRLTSPKIFTYGDTRSFASMASSVPGDFPCPQWVLVGFSMGANIVVKYLGEQGGRQKGVLCAVSLCQGYDAERHASLMKVGPGRFYDYMMTLNFKKILRPHWGDIFSCGSDYDEGLVREATSLYHIEEGLLRRFEGFKSVAHFKKSCGCQDDINNISIPILLLNSEDDPIISPRLFDVPLSYIKRNPRSLFVTTKHGGHLGFFEGSWWFPNSETLLERLVLEYVDSVADAVANDSVANDSVANDSVANDSVANDSVANDSVANDSVANDSVANDTVANDSVADAVANDSVANDSVANDSVANDSVANDSVANDTVANDSVADAVANDSVANDSVANDSVANDSVANDSVANDTVANDSVAGCVANDSVANDSVANDSVANDFVANDSVANDSVANDSVANDAVANDSVANDSVANDAVANDSVAKDS